jgi:hypothetical protein
VDQSSGGTPGAGAAAGAIVVRQSRAQRDGLFGALIAVFLVALVRGYTGAQTSAGRVAVVVFVAVFTAVLGTGWVRLIRRPCRLEITTQAITFVDGRGAARVLSSETGGQLRIVSLGGGRFRQPGLTIAGSGTVIALPFFSTKEVRRQCLAAGWIFTAGRRSPR